MVQVTKMADSGTTGVTVETLKEKDSVVGGDKK